MVGHTPKEALPWTQSRGNYKFIFPQVSVRVQLSSWFWQSPACCQERQFGPSPPTPPLSLLLASDTTAVLWVQPAWYSNWKQNLLSSDDPSSQAASRAGTKGGRVAATGSQRRGNPGWRLSQAAQSSAGHNQWWKHTPRYGSATGFPGRQLISFGLLPTSTLFCTVLNACATVGEVVPGAISWGTEHWFFSQGQDEFSCHLHGSALSWEHWWRYKGEMATARHSPRASACSALGSELQLPELLSEPTLPQPERTGEGALKPHRGAWKHAVCERLCI